jgi:hypothetical protein
MNRTFNPTSLLQRSMFALAAVLAMLATVGAIEGLIGHYNVESQLASTKPSQVAQR